MKSLSMTIQGMSCGHCVGSVTKALEGLGGVQIEHVMVGSAVVRYDPAAVSPADIAGAVTNAGYEATVVQ